MAELLIAIFLLLAVENAVFSALLKNNEFLSLDAKNGGAISHGVSLGVLTMASILISTSVFHSEGMLIPSIIALVASGLFAAYCFFIKKDKKWYFSIALIINTVSAVLLSGVFAQKGIFDSTIVQAIVSGIGSMVAVLCFVGLKDNFSREKRTPVMLCINAAALLVIAICAFVGFAV